MPFFEKLFHAKAFDAAFLMCGAALLFSIVFTRKVSPDARQWENIYRIELYQYLCEEYAEAVDHTRI